MKDSLVDYKCKLIQDLDKKDNQLGHDSNNFYNTRKVSSGVWKESLSKEEVNFIEGLDDELLKDTIKNRIELEEKKTSTLTK